MDAVKQPQSNGDNFSHRQNGPSPKSPMLRKIFSTSSISDKSSAAEDDQSRQQRRSLTDLNQSKSAAPTAEPNASWLPHQPKKGMSKPLPPKLSSEPGSNKPSEQKILNPYKPKNDSLQNDLPKVEKHTALNFNILSPLPLNQRRGRSLSDFEKSGDDIPLVVMMPMSVKGTQESDLSLRPSAPIQLVLPPKLKEKQIQVPPNLLRQALQQPHTPPRPVRARRIGRRTRWLIPADHPCKIAWDVMTILISFLSAFHTHSSIRDRSFGRSPFLIFCETWFAIDILLNFVTEHKTSEGTVLRDGKSIWARYLTTWFAVDVLSLLPWEALYVKPIIDMQNRRGFFKKSFFRTRAVVRVTRVLRGRHFRLFGKVARHTKGWGVGARRLLRLLIKYVPKYLLFFRNMKGAIMVRTLRLMHWLHKLIKVYKKGDDETSSLTQMDEDWTDEEEEDEDGWELQPEDDHEDVPY